MAIKDLAVAYNGSTNAVAALSFAIQMCKQYDAALTGIHVRVPLSFEPQVRRWMPKDVLEGLKTASDEGIQEIETGFREAVAFITSFLEDEGVPHRVVDPKPEFPNVVGTFQGAGPGRHLVLNGHIDVFPVADDPAAEGWTHEPWGAELDDGRLYGRGACDMKPGTTASLWTYVLLHRIRDRLDGELTLTAVSDEETFGPWGARYLMEHVPEVRGDCCLNGEPSSPLSVRYGEKGPLWLEFTVRTRGAHGAYTHASESATRIASSLIVALGEVEGIEWDLPDNILRAHDEGTRAADRAMGEGAGRVLPQVTLNVGTIEGGLKVNMVPGECRFEADFRLPPGVTREQVMRFVDDTLASYPQASVSEINYSAPSYCDPYGEMMAILRRNVKALRGFEPSPVVSLGGTDARLWRQAGIPAYVYGVFPHGMGAGDEHCDVEDFLHVVRTHVLSAYDYLTAGR